MARWLRAAHFQSLYDATRAAKRLEALFAGRTSFVVYRFVSPGPTGDQALFVAGLGRDLDEVTPHIEAQARQALQKGGSLTRVPEIIHSMLFEDWSQLVREPISRVEGLAFRSGLDIITEDPVAETSHARCRDCGQARHKFARFNLCQPCWEKVKPTVRRQWREMKNRRSLRQAVEDHIEEQHRARAAQAELRQLREQANAHRGEGAVELTDQEAAKREIARLKAEGLVPKPNTPEFGPYMRLWQIARGYNSTGKREVFEPDDLDRLVVRLYSDSNVPVKSIINVLHYDPNRLPRLRREFNLPNREDVLNRNPTAVMDKSEEFLMLDGEPVFRHRLSHHVRLAFAPREEEPPPVPEPEHAPVETKVHDAPLTSRGTPRKRAMLRRSSPLTEEEAQEILRLYDDFSIPVDEIMRAYSLSTGGLDRLMKKYQVVLRTQRPGFRLGPKPKGQLQLVDGRQTWVPGEPEQLHLGEAPGAQEEKPVTPQPPSPNGPQTAQEAQQTRELAPAVLVPGDIVLNRRDRSWAISYITTRTILINAESIDDAIQLVRQKVGGDVDITNVQRT